MYFSLFFLIKSRAKSIIPTVHPIEIISFDLLLLEFELISLELLPVSESTIGSSFLLEVEVEVEVLEVEVEVELEVELEVEEIEVEI